MTVEISRSEIPQWINGNPTKLKGRKLEIYDPVQGKMIRQVGVADQSVVNQAVASASSAFQTWGLTTPAQRAKILFRFKALLDQNVKQLAQLVTEEHGKILDEAIGSVQRGIEVVDFICGIPNHLKGEFAEQASLGIDVYSMHQPLGVCAGITPFNFPAMIPLWMFPMAIATGNTFVLKPSEQDPLVTMR